VTVKLLVLTKYGRSAASARQRFVQFFPALEREGISIVHHALLGDEYLAALVAGTRPSILPVARAYLERWRLLRRASRFDLALIQYEAFPWLPPFAERALARMGVPFVLDFDDAIFHQYGEHRSALVRSLLGGKLAETMRAAAAVHAGSAYIAEYAGLAGARRVELLPTVVDTRSLSPDEGNATREGFRIGWIGSPSTSAYLADVAPALRAFCDRHSGARIVLVGARDDALAGLPVERRAWSEEREREDLRSMDVGIMPLRDDAWSRGKCGFKLIQYMACGLPVVASPVGTNRDIVRDGVNGLLATSGDQWEAALERLAASAEERLRMGMAGRAAVEGRYSVEAVLPRLVDSLRSAATARSTRFGR